MMKLMLNARVSIFWEEEDGEFSVMKNYGETITEIIYSGIYICRGGAPFDYWIEQEQITCSFYDSFGE